MCGAVEEVVERSVGSFEAEAELGVAAAVEVCFGRWPVMGRLYSLRGEEEEAASRTARRGDVRSEERSGRRTFRSELGRS